MTIKINKQLNRNETVPTVVNDAVRQTQQSVNDLINNRIPSAILTTRGDLIIATTAGAPTRLGAGTAGQILQTQGTSADPAWSWAGVRGTVQATTSGTTFDFTIPAGVRRITVMLDQVSTSGTDNLLIQVGTGGTPTTSGYFSASSDDASSTTSTAGFLMKGGGATNTVSGVMTILNLTGNTWVSEHGTARQTSNTACGGGGTVSLAGTLNIVRLATTGADSFDAGQVNVLYE